MSKSVFYHGVVSDSAGVVIGASDATRAIDAATVTNTTGSAATLTLWQVPSAGSRADANVLVKDLSVLADTTIALAPIINHAISRGATIHAEASAASSLTLIVSGRSQ
jgi:hypothetical protein